MLVINLFDRLKYFANGLQVFAFTGVLALKLRHQILYVHTYKVLVRL